MHVLQIIYTLEDGTQLFANFPFDRTIIRSKGVLILFAKRALSYKYYFLPDSVKSDNITKGKYIPNTVQEVPKITKLSCSVYMNAEIAAPLFPDWYNKCNGKLYEEDLNPVNTLSDTFTAVQISK